MSRMDEIARNMTAGQLYKRGKDYRDGKVKTDGIRSFPDPEMAEKYFEKAAEKGHAEAQKELERLREGFATNIFLQSHEFDKLIAVTKEFWDECDYMGNPGAAKDDINKLTKRIKKLHTIPAPNGYIAFMKKLNGFKYKDFEIYSCREVKKVKQNAGRHFIFGKAGEKYLGYNNITGEYKLLRYIGFAFTCAPVQDFL